MSIKLLGTALLTAVLLSGGMLMQGPLTPSFALSPPEVIEPLPPVHLNWEDSDSGDDQAGDPGVQGDEARLLRLMQQSDAIVTGTVIGEAHALNGTAAVTTLEVRDWLKGGDARYIRIVQTACEGGKLLQSGESYLLMLGAAAGQAPDLYRISGRACEGKFTQLDGSWANDDPLLTNALQAWSAKQPAAMAAKLATEA